LNFFFFFFFFFFFGSYTAGEREKKSCLHVAVDTLIANEKVVSYTARGIAARGGKKKTTTIINWRESITLLFPLAACSILL
jgi:hypothetical protein